MQYGIRKFMSYASTYGCGEFTAEHFCHDCPGGTVREYGRCRSGAFVRKTYLAALLVDPTDPAVWQTGIDSGDIIILPETSGSYDPGDHKELKGYGDRPTSSGPATMTLTLFDPEYYENYAFYNEIKDRTDLVPVFRTSNLLHIFDKPATITAKDPVADDLEEEVVWAITCKVISANLPTLHLAEAVLDIFTCATF